MKKYASDMNRQVVAMLGQAFKNKQLQLLTGIPGECKADTVLSLYREDLRPIHLLSLLFLMAHIRDTREAQIEYD